MGNLVDFMVSRVVEDVGWGNGGRWVEEMTSEDEVRGEKIGAYS